MRGRDFSSTCCSFRRNQLFVSCLNEPLHEPASSIWSHALQWWFHEGLREFLSVNRKNLHYPEVEDPDLRESSRRILKLEIVNLWRYDKRR